MNTPNHPLRLLGMALIAFASTHALAQCDDALACNFDANSEGTDGCVYFDTDNFLLSENDFIGLYEFEECPDGYAGWNDLVVPLGPGADGGPLQFTLFEAVEFVLIANGFETLYNDLSTASVSVCGDTMNYLSTIDGDLNLIWDGMGFENPAYGGYIAPETSYAIGCPDPDACNFDPCTNPLVTESCELLQGGTIIGDTLVTNGNSYTYTYEGGAEGSTYVYYTACGDVPADEQGGDNVVTFTFDFPQDCELCVQESNEVDCSITTCLTLTPDGANLVEEFQSRWSIMPNPAHDHVTVAYDGATAPWGIYDQLGREVRTIRIATGQNTIDLSDLAPGTYLIGPLNGPKRQVQIVD